MISWAISCPFQPLLIRIACMHLSDKSNFVLYMHLRLVNLMSVDMSRKTVWWTAQRLQSSFRVAQQDAYIRSWQEYGN